MSLSCSDAVFSIPLPDFKKKTLGILSKVSLFEFLPELSFKWPGFLSKVESLCWEFSIVLFFISEFAQSIRHVQFCHSFWFLQCFCVFPFLTLTLYALIKWHTKHYRRDCSYGGSRCLSFLCSVLPICRHASVCLPNPTWKASWYSHMAFFPQCFINAHGGISGVQGKQGMKVATNEHI